jgi:crossover junction endodeoxyribonuclease RuvC
MPRYPLSAWRTFRPEAVGVALSMPARCRILGLDPGSQRTGYGILDCTAAGETHVANGCINVTGGALSVRLRRIFEAISALIQEHRPDEIAIERVFVHRNPDSALKLGQARGAALCAAVGLGAPAHEYAPRAIKLAVTGYGAADKRQVARMVATLLTLGALPGADAADALAVALCHAQGRRLAALGAAPRASARRAGASP